MTINFSNNDILIVIINFDLNKGQGYNMISIRMIKICDDFICKPLKLIFQSCFNNGKFPSDGKKPMWFQLIERMTSKYEETTGQYHYFLLLREFLRG